jgi:hypothetical protein
MIIAIDPGTTESAVVTLRPGEPVPEFSPLQPPEIAPNQYVFEYLTAAVLPGFTVVIEDIQSYGMPVGKETFRTAQWSGAFAAEAKRMRGRVYLLGRRWVKRCICNSMCAKDANVRRAILDLYPATGGGATPQIGTKKQPGPLYGIKSHMWSALAVGLTAQNEEAMEKAEEWK